MCTCSISLAQGPDNDFCATALDLNLGTTSVSTIGAGSEYYSRCSEKYEVWYKLTTEKDTGYLIEVCLDSTPINNYHIRSERLFGYQE